MASYATVIRNHLLRFFSIVVAVQAGKPFHAHAVDHPVCMAVGTGLLVRQEPVQVAEVALSAADVLHKDMPRMPIGVAQALGSLGNIRNMTCPAGIPWRDPSVLLLYRLVALYDEGDQHLILLKKCHGMAHLTRVIPVLAFLPGLECLLHEMTGHTKVRVFLRITIIAVRENATNDRDQEEQDNNGFLVLFYETDKPGGVVRQALPSSSVQKPKEFVQEKGKDISHKGAECRKNSENHHKYQRHEEAL